MGVLETGGTLGPCVDVLGLRDDYVLRFRVLGCRVVGFRV